MPFEGSFFGPDGNCRVDLNHIYTLHTPLSRLIRFSFSSEARYENAIVIYGGGGSQPQKVAVKGNRGPGGSQGDLTTFEVPPLHALEAYYVTGWHKDAFFEPKLGWGQDLMKVASDNGRVIDLWFEDVQGAQGDFNDIRCRIEIVGPE